MATTAALYNEFDRQPLTLDTLALLDTRELEEIYREGKPPRDVAALNGRPKGRMLAARGIDQTPLADLVAGLAASERFPWDGKTFQAHGKTTGEGINRIRLGRDFTWFPFQTRIEPSVLDGRECLYLDYEQPGNPWFIRKIRDELREVSPGLFLGPAMWKQGAGRAARVLWFALDARQQQ